MKLFGVLRNLGVTTIVATGVSVNIAIPNLVMDAVNRGYQVVVPRDAVAGIPADYADAGVTYEKRWSRLLRRHGIVSVWPLLTFPATSSLGPARAEC
ncbi:hypothetical protein FAIPA1_30286 [Frankia sp. AiPs1]|nr:isochorismatase family protein [Frankia sp. AiPa1]MCL9759992.1 cysteine hydrolase [Frankia sp. AiPa1]